MTRRTWPILLLFAAGCQWLAGINDRSAAADDSSSAGSGGVSTAGAGGSSHSAGATLEAGQSSVAGVGAGAGSAGVAGSSSCPATSFVDPSPLWSVKEGDAAGTSLALALSLGQTDAADWRVVLSDAPAWVSAPSTLISNTSLELEAPAGVPFDAFPGPATFTVRIELKSDSACSAEANVSLGVSNVLRAALDYQALPDGISWAAWHSESESFYLLDAAAGRFYTLDTSTDPAEASSPITLPASGSVAPHAFAVSSDRVHAVINDSLYRMDLGGAAIGAAIPITSPAPGGELTMAWAGGFILVADEAGPMRAIEDSLTAFEAASYLPWSNASTLVSDGGSFGFRTGNWNVWRAVPTSWDAASCAAPSESASMALSGQMVAWLTITSPVLNFATVDGSCAGQDSIALDGVSEFYQPLGLSNGMALVADVASAGVPRKIDLALYDLESGMESAERLSNQNVAGTEFAIVMGGLEYALVLTVDAGGARRPLLVKL